MPDVDFNDLVQLSLLDKFNYVQEIRQNFASDNENFCAGDIDFLYNMVRYFKPHRIIEIGSGFSSRISICALKKNEEEGFLGHLTCIEPYEMPWLEEEKSITLIRKRVEEVAKKCPLMQQYPESEPGSFWI